MNSQGQVGVWGYALMLGLVIIILGLALAPAGRDFINSAMNTSTADFIGLDCGNASISNFDKGTCVIADFSLPYFFGGIILIGGAIVVAKILI